MAVNKITERTSSRGGRPDPTDQSDPTNSTDQTGHCINLHAMSALNINDHERRATNWLKANPCTLTTLMCRITYETTTRSRKLKADG
jgi:hypothetical protein